MIVVDTNIVVRLLVGEADAARQRQEAEMLLGAGDVRLLLTVILETEWVLRSRYRFAGPQVAAALRRLVALPGVEVEDADRVARALDWFASGLDFADALHLAATGDGESFVTFDHDLIRRAGRLGVAVPVREP